MPSFGKIHKVMLCTLLVFTAGSLQVNIAGKVGRQQHRIELNTEKCCVVSVVKVARRKLNQVLACIQTKNFEQKIALLVKCTTVPMQ